MEKVAARGFAKTYLTDLHHAVLESLVQSGHFFDPVEKEVESVFMPWLVDAAAGCLENITTARTITSSMFPIRANMHNLLSHAGVTLLCLEGSYSYSFTFSSTRLPAFLFICISTLSSDLLVLSACRHHERRAPGPASAPGCVRAVRQVREGAASSARSPAEKRGRGEGQEGGRRGG